MRHFITFGILILCFPIFCLAQTPNGLIAYYPFDNALNDVSGNGYDGIPNGNPGYGCGILGNALQLDGIDDYIQFAAIDETVFQTGDFSISIYFKPTSLNGVRQLLGKRVGCINENAFEIRYSSGNRVINATLIESPNKSININITADLTTCWQHLVLTRNGNRVKTYLNGVFEKEGTQISRVDLTNMGVFNIANSDCINMGVQRFQGFVDEMKIFDRELNAEEIRQLHQQPDKIINNDTTIFLGGSVDITTSPTCATNFMWSPGAAVSNIFINNPTITPTTTTTYFLSFDHGLCTAKDSIEINVVDPNDLDCSEIFLPNVFTPNDDGRNDEFGISNPLAVEKLISFEILDRWGSIVFTTIDPFEKWDGSFNGDPMNPGVLLYRMRIECMGEELVKVGSLSILK